MFQLGEEFQETTVDGRDVVVVVVMEKGRIVSRQTATRAGERSTLTTRQLDQEGRLVYTLTIEGSPHIVCVQIFRRIE